MKRLIRLNDLQNYSDATQIPSNVNRLSFESYTDNAQVKWRFHFVGIAFFVEFKLSFFFCFVVRLSLFIDFYSYINKTFCTLQVIRIARLCCIYKVQKLVFYP